MKSIIFKTSAKYLLPVLMLFSVFMLLRGHYLPGGGFFHLLVGRRGSSRTLERGR
ncbi:hypothetical protein B9T07_26960, partial [Limnospira fusiformis CCALA 023]